MQKIDLKTLSTLLNSTIYLSEVEYASSLILARKTLEKIIHGYYEFKDIEKPLNDEGYTVLSGMINDLQKRKIITTKTKEDCDYIRRIGNDAAHYTDKGFTKKDINKSIQLLCKVINELLRKQKLKNNSVFILTMRKGKLSNSVKLDHKIKSNQKYITDILTRSIFTNFNYLTDIYDEVDLEFYEDEELYNYAEAFFDLVFKYYDWYWEFDPADYSEGIWRRLFGGSSKVTPASTFKEYYEDRLEYLYEQRDWLKSKYGMK